MPNHFAGPRLALALALLSSAAVAQTSASAPSTSLYAANAVEITAAQKAAQADTRVSSRLGTGPALVAVSGVQLIKAETAPYLSGQGARPNRYISVVMYNQRTATAVDARVQLGTSRVVSVKPVGLDELPFFREEAEQAVALAKANAGVRAAVGPSLDNYRLRLPGYTGAMPYAAEIMPLYASSARDRCFTGRCVEIHFRTPTGYLPLRAEINLAARTVTVLRRNPSQRHGGMH